MVKIITTATITRYKFKGIWGFLGVMFMAIIVGCFIYIESWLLQILLAVIGWFVCGYLIEKEVNNWLNKKAKLNITNTIIIEDGNL